MGAYRAAFARERQAGQAVKGPPHGRKRHPVEAQDRGALARPARTLRLVADLVRSLRPLAARRDVGSVPGPSADEVRRGGRGRVGGQRRQHRCPGASARGRRPPQAGTQRRKKGLEHPEDEALGRSRGGLSTKVHLGLRREGAPALGGRDAGPAPREHAAGGRARRHPGGAPGLEAEFDEFVASQGAHDSDS